jgi:phosphate:Na+ symporter
MVIGANLGSAANPVVSALGGGPERLRVPVGNMITRIAGCVLCVPLVGPAASALPWISPGPARQAANFHLLFNAALALLFIGLLPLLARALERLFPVRIRIHDPGTPQYLDEAALATPSVALSNAAREVLRMADAAESMLRGSQDAFRQADQRHIAAISRMDDVLDRLYGAVQRYVGAIGHDGLSEGEAQRVSEILALAINLEHIGDIVDKNLLDLASKRIRDGLVLSADAAERIEDMHNRLLDHLQLAVAVFMSGDVVAARRLVAEKEGFRDLERETTRLHFETMRTGQRSSIEASSLQLDITRDLKRIEAHIAATAYGLLERSGELRASRLSDGGGYDERRAPEARAVGPSTGHTGE